MDREAESDAAAHGEDLAPSDEVEERTLLGRGPLNAIQVNGDEFIDSWHKAIEAVQAVFATDEVSPTTGMQLDSVTAKLSITGKGKVAFIAELGGEVAFEATFKRRA